MADQWESEDYEGQQQASHGDEAGSAAEFEENLGYEGVINRPGPGSTGEYPQPVDDVRVCDETVGSRAKQAPGSYRGTRNIPIFADKWEPPPNNKRDRSRSRSRSRTPRIRNGSFSSSGTTKSPARNTKELNESVRRAHEEMKKREVYRNSSTGQSHSIRKPCRTSGSSLERTASAQQNQAQTDIEKIGHPTTSRQSSSLTGPHKMPVRSRERNGSLQQAPVKVKVEKADRPNSSNHPPLASGSNKGPVVSQAHERNNSFRSIQMRDNVEEMGPSSSSVQRPISVRASNTVFVEQKKERSAYMQRSPRSTNVGEVNHVGILRQPGSATSTSAMASYHGKINSSVHRGHLLVTSREPSTSLEQTSMARRHSAAELPSRSSVNSSNSVRNGHEKQMRKESCEKEIMERKMEALRRKMMAENEDLKFMNETLRKKIAVLETAAEKQVGEFEATVRCLQELSSKVTQERKDLLRQVEQLKKEIAGEKLAADELQAENRALERKVRRVDQLFAEATVRLDEERRKTEQYKKQAHRADEREVELSTQVIEMEKELSGERSKARRMQTEISHWKAKTRKLRHEVHDLKSGSAQGSSDSTEGDSPQATSGEGEGTKLLLDFDQGGKPRCLSQTTFRIGCY